MEEERQLIEQVLTGDRNAFETMIQRYKRLVGHLVFRIIPNNEDREEVAQDVFLKVFQKLSSFRGDARLGTWIGQIAHHTCLNYLKKKKLPVSDLLPEEIQVSEGKDQQPDRLLEKAQKGEFIRHQIKQIPPQYGQVLTLFHLEELEIKEISTILDMPEGTVKNYLFRGRKLLKERLLRQSRKEAIWN